MSTVVKSKIVLKDLGDPKLIATLAPNENQLLLGTIIGIADGIKIAKGADQMTEFKGLKGQFEAIPANPERDTVRSGVAFIGDSFQVDIVKMLESTDEKGNANGPDSVSFGFEIYVVRASNAAGYSWALKPLMQASEADPLSALRKELTAPAAVAQIAGKK